MSPAVLALQLIQRMKGQAAYVMAEGVTQHRQRCAENFLMQGHLDLGAFLVM